MEKTGTYYKCKSCGRLFSTPTPHKCVDGFRSHGLEFDQCPAPDMVNHPPHYTWLRDLAGIEVIDITRHMNFNLGNAVKYILRAGRKDPDKQIEDLRKAEFYIKDEINRLTNESK